MLINALYVNQCIFNDYMLINVFFKKYIKKEKKTNKKKKNIKKKIKIMTGVIPDQSLSI